MNLKKKNKRKQLKKKVVNEANSSMDLAFIQEHRACFSLEF